MSCATERLSPPSTPPLRVFLVEDSPAVRDLLTEQLTDIEHVSVVGTAQSEDAAIAEMRQTPCDVVILDIKLRGGNGIGVLRALHSLDTPSHWPSTRIIFSNYTESEYRALAKRYGAQYFFDKSADLIALLDVIKNLSTLG